METAFDPHLAALLAICATSLVGVLFAIVRLVRSGRSVDFPSVEVRPRADIRSGHGDHVAIR
jgi:hypothetical protein